MPHATGKALPNCGQITATQTTESGQVCLPEVTACEGAHRDVRFEL